jgi:Rieske Fe-S protein
VHHLLVTSWTRRALLRATGAGLGVAGLAGCASGTPVPSVSGSGPGTALTSLEDLPVGAATELEVAGRRIVLTRPTDATVLGFDARCPHQGCTVRATTDGGLGCPCHGSTFDPATGAPVEGPADRPLDEVGVEVRGTDVVLT